MLIIKFLNAFTIYEQDLYPGIFPSTFLQPVNSSRNSNLELSCEIQFLHVLFSFFVFETPLKDFSFYSSILLTLWFRYLQTHIEESCMYLSTQLLCKAFHETLKFQEKSKKSAFSSNL